MKTPQTMTRSSALFFGMTPASTESATALPTAAWAGPNICTACFIPLIVTFVTSTVAEGKWAVMKGATTVVAEPDGQVLIVTAGDQRLATAGTGDVLAGIIGAFIAMQIDPFEAAAMGAWVHGRASMAGHAVGFVASDLPDLVPAVLAELRART